MENSLVPLYKPCFYGYNFNVEGIFWFYYKRGKDLCFVVQEKETGEMHYFLDSVPLRFTNPIIDDGVIVETDTVII